jgi:hypothetical protein
MTTCKDRDGNWYGEINYVEGRINPEPPIKDPWYVTRIMELEADAKRWEQQVERMRAVVEAAGKAVHAENYENDVNGDEHVSKPDVCWPESYKLLEAALIELNSMAALEE